MHLRYVERQHTANIAPLKERRPLEPMAETRGRFEGQERTTLVVFGDAGTQPLLGAYTMEGFGVAPDPLNRRLIPVPGLLM